MRILFKTDYLIDVRWFADRFTMLWYGALLLLLAGAPALMSHYLLGEVSLVLIWLVGGLGMMLLTEINIGYYQDLMRGLRAAIASGQTAAFREQTRRDWSMGERGSTGAITADDHPHQAP